MNKKLIALIPFLMVISACSNGQAVAVSSSEESQLTTSISTEESSFGEESTSESNEQLSSEEESSEEQLSSEDSSSEEQSSESEEIEYQTKQFVFEGSSTRQYLHGGVKLEDANPKSAFTAIFNSEEEFLKDYTSSGVTFQLVGHEDDTTTSLCIGTAKADGELVLNFNVSIYAISFELENYYKRYTDQNGDDQVSYDADSRVDITLGNGLVSEEYDLSAETYKQVTINGEMKTPDNTPVTKVTFSNLKKQRVYVHSLTISYLAE